MTLAIKRVKTPTGVGYALVSGDQRLTKPTSYTDALAQYQRKRRPTGKNPCQIPG